MLVSREGALVHVSFLLSATAVASGCWTDPAIDVTPEVRLACDDDADCPPSWRCRPLEPPRCLPEGGDGPALASAPNWVRDVAAAGQTLEVELIFDTRLLFAPEVIGSFVSGARAFTVDDGDDPDDATWTARHLVTGDEGEGAATVRVLATSAGTAGEATDDVGEAFVDLTPPALAAAASVTPATAGSGTEVTLSFTLSEPAGTTPQVELRPEGVTPIAFTHASGDANVFSYVFTPDGSEPSGSWPIVARAVDVAGNDTGPLDVGTLTIDLDAPDVVPGTATFEIAGPSGGLVDEPAQLSVGATVTVSFVADDDLGVDPVVVGAVGATTLTFAQESANGRVYRFASTLPAGSDEGTVDVTATLRDTAGNEAARTLGFTADLVVDTTEHTALTPATLALMRYERAPWGETSTAGVPDFRVSGAPGAVEPRAHVIVLDDIDPSAALVVGRGRAADDGSFGPIVLNARDRAFVYAWPHDEAGNPPAAPDAVGSGRWVATPAGRIAGNDDSSPHAVIARPNAPAIGVAELRLGDLELGGTGPGVEGDGAVAESSSAGYWRRLDGENDRPPSAGPMAYDSWRGVTVLFAGANGTWEWDGRRWSERNTLVAPPSSNASMVFDSWRGVTLLRGHYFGLWSWDGATWAKLPDSLEYLPLNPSMAFDEARGVAVVYGRPLDVPFATGVSIHEWDGYDWTVVPEPDPRPPTRETPQLVGHPTLGVVMYGGCAPPPPLTSACSDGGLDDTWSWDGASWTEHTGASAGARFWGDLVYDPVDERVLLIGGTDTVSASTEWPIFAWSGSGWSDAGLGDNPAAPERTAAWDVERARLITARSAFNELVHSEWAPWGWTDPLSKPEPRLTPLVWDGGREVFLMFGGLDTSNGASLSDTWEHDGHSWRERTPATTPGGRDFHGLAYDEARGVVVMFGGSPGGDETWEWDGVDWTAGPSGPSSRWDPALAWDSSRQAVVLYGGQDAPSPFLHAPNDLWRYDADGWTEITGSGDLPPTTLSTRAIAHDPIRDVIVMRGYDDDVGRARTWEIDGAVFTEVSTEQSGLDSVNAPVHLWFDVGVGRVRAESGGQVHTWRPEEVDADRRWQIQNEVLGTVNISTQAPVAIRSDVSQIVLFSEGELWQLATPLATPSAIEVVFDARSPGPATATSWDVADLRVVAGGGAAGSGGVALELFVEGAWQQIASSTAPADAPEALTWSANDQRVARLLGQRGARVRVVGTGEPPGRVSLDYAELAVEHSGVRGFCGDSRINGEEECDDGDAFGGDGCGETCLIEFGFSCDAAEPTNCQATGSFCSDATLADSQCTCGCNAVDVGCPGVTGTIIDCDSFSDGCFAPLQPVAGDLSRCERQ
jgi:cysteine-rich repeat protein